MIYFTVKMFNMTISWDTKKTFAFIKKSFQQARYRQIMKAIKQKPALSITSKNRTLKLSPLGSGEVQAYTVIAYFCLY